jgi:cysteine desulfurase/selenocysteine lyase
MLKADDEVIVSRMEHHSNIVPWQLACEKSGAVLKVVGIDQNGDLLLDDYQQLFTKKTKIVAITHTSNSLGTINPIKQIVDIAHQHQVPVLLDGAQGIKSCGIDVQAVDCDFYCFSGHKIYAPMGIGVLYGKEHWLEQLPPYQGGGEMIKHVSFEKTTFNDLPFKFEAGTPNVAGAIGLQHALQFVEEVGHQQMIDYEKELLRYAVEQMKEIENIRLIGTAKEKSAIISFLLGNHHPADTGTLIDFMGIAVRTGHHCTQPLMDYLNIPGTVRASFAVYNTKKEIDVFVKALRSAQNMLD